MLFSLRLLKYNKHIIDIPIISSIAMNSGIRINRNSLGMTRSYSSSSELELGLKVEGGTVIVIAIKIKIKYK